MLVRAAVAGSAAVASAVLALAWFTSGAAPRPTLAADVVGQADAQIVAGGGIGSQNPLIDLYVTNNDLPPIRCGRTIC